MRILVLLLFALPAFAGEVAIDNDYVRVTRNALSCATPMDADCGERVVVALEPMLVTVSDKQLRLGRGAIAVFSNGESPSAADGSFFEVVIKANHPAAVPPGERIAPDKNAMLYEGRDFFVFEEKLSPGDTRARHSHSQRVVIQLNRARLQQWPDGEPEKIVETVPDKPSFSPPVVHSVRNIGDIPLRGIIIEFKPD